MLNLKVELGENSYPIFIGEDILSRIGEMLTLYNFSPHTFILTDSTVDSLYGAEIVDAFKALTTVEKMVLPEGEKSKSLSEIDEVMTRMLEIGYDRNASVIAFGGGVVGDIAGFAASIYKRGVRYIQVPTTLLAQVDSSVGGKTGVNHALGKNMVGTFYQPKLVWIDLGLLKSLPQREILCGLGEIIKYGIIWDADLFKTIEEELDALLALDTELLQDIVYRCCEIKAEVVAKDEKESGLRMILNLGHTVGHALETSTGYKKLSHGEGVLLGCVCESKIALDKGVLAHEDFDRIITLITRLPLTNMNRHLEPGRLIEFMKSDKKSVAGKIKFVLPARIGETVTRDDVGEQEIASAIAYLERLSS